MSMCGMYGVSYLHGLGIGQVDKGGLVGLEGDEFTLLEGDVAEDDFTAFLKEEVVHHLSKHDKSISQSLI